jgi:hypothetical protein
MPSIVMRQTCLSLIAKALWNISGGLLWMFEKLQKSLHRRYSSFGEQQAAATFAI